MVGRRRDCSSSVLEQRYTPCVEGDVEKQRLNGTEGEKEFDCESLGESEYSVGMREEIFFVAVKVLSGDEEKFLFD